MATARSRPELATTVGSPRRSGAASSTSSWTSVAIWTSSIAVAARIAVAPPSGPAQRSTSSGRIPLAASGKGFARIRAELGTPPLDQILKTTLDVGHLGRQPGGGHVDDRGDRLGRRGAARHDRSGLVAEWIAMIPPARTVQRMSSSPAPSMIAARPAGGGKRFTDSGR